jgi:MerC mercury resistance protein
MINSTESQALETSNLDRWAIGLSGICVAHCLATSVFFAFAAAAGGVFFSHVFHAVGLTIAIIFGVIALARGVTTHGYAMPVWVGSLGLGLMAGALFAHESGMETFYTVLGVLILALGHDLNRRAVV